MNDFVSSDSEQTVVVGPADGERTQVVSQPQAETTSYAAGADCPVCGTTNPPSETYCTDCGFELSGQPVAPEESPISRPAVKLVACDGTREFALRQGENTVGRENADVLLVHNTVSRRHAVIFLEESGVYIEDSNSTNGTLVDGGRAEAGSRTQLRDGAEIVFGSVALRLAATMAAVEEAAAGEAAAGFAEPPVEEPAEQAPVEADSADASPDEEVEPEAAVVAALVSQDGQTVLAVLEGSNTIGRRQGGNSIVIADPYCSGRHAELVAADGTLTLTDVGSTNGTMVNGVRLEPNMSREISEGDEITFGRSVFRVEGATDGLPRVRE